MNKTGPVIIVDDDEDDRELISDVFKNLNIGNETIFFRDGQQAYDHLTASEVRPFLIMSDVNMPGLSGPELCIKIRTEEHLHGKFIPFVYFTTSTTRSAIAQAYNAGANGFFIKPSSIAELQSRIESIVGYWRDCQLPTDYD